MVMCNAKNTFTSPACTGHQCFDLLESGSGMTINTNWIGEHKERKKERKKEWKKDRQKERKKEKTEGQTWTFFISTRYGFTNPIQFQNLAVREPISVDCTQTASGIMSAQPQAITGVFDVCFPYARDKYCSPCAALRHQSIVDDKGAHWSADLRVL